MTQVNHLNQLHYLVLRWIKFLLTVPVNNMIRFLLESKTFNVLLILSLMILHWYKSIPILILDAVLVWLSPFVSSNGLLILYCNCCDSGMTQNF
jgi:hypothetical protein